MGPCVDVDVVHLWNIVCYMHYYILQQLQIIHIVMFKDGPVVKIKRSR